MSKQVEELLTSRPIIPTDTIRYYYILFEPDEIRKKIVNLCAPILPNCIIFSAAEWTQWDHIKKFLYYHRLLPYWSHHRNHTSGKVARWISVILAIAYHYQFYPNDTFVLLEDDIVPPHNLDAMIRNTFKRYPQNNIFKYGYWGELYIFKPPGLYSFLSEIYTKGIMDHNDMWITKILRPITQLEVIAIVDPGDAEKGNIGGSTHFTIGEMLWEPSRVPYVIKPFNSIKDVDFRKILENYADIELPISLSVDAIHPPQYNNHRHSFNTILNTYIPSSITQTTRYHKRYQNFKGIEHHWRLAIKKNSRNYSYYKNMISPIPYTNKFE